MYKSPTFINSIANYKIHKIGSSASLANIFELNVSQNNLLYPQYSKIKLAYTRYLIYLSERRRKHLKDKGR